MHLETLYLWGSFDSELLCGGGAGGVFSSVLLVKKEVNVSLVLTYFHLV